MSREPEHTDANDMVRAIFNAYERRQPHRDPGDLTIEIQDDMPLVQITAQSRGMIGTGSTLSEALSDALATAEGRQDAVDGLEGVR